MAVKMATRNPSAKFISRHGQNAICQHCGRNLGMTYLLNIDGEDVIMGRRCAARTLGWATTAVEMEAIRVERMTEIERRRAIIRAEYPALADAEHRCNYVHPAVMVRGLGEAASNHLYTLRSILLTASNEDYFWDETHRNYGRYGTWAEYIDNCLR